MRNHIALRGDPVFSLDPILKRRQVAVPIDSLFGVRHAQVEPIGALAGKLGYEAV